MLILRMAILTCCVCVIRTAGFSHLHQCVPPERLKSTAKDFHVPVYIGNNKTELGASNHENLQLSYAHSDWLFAEADFPSQKATEL